MPIPAPTHAPVHHLAVIAIGSDVSATGDLQREIEQRVGTIPGVSVHGASELASILGSAEPDEAVSFSDFDVSDDDQKASAAILADATQAYYEDRGADALDKLAQLAALYAKSPFPVADQVRLHLWRAAVYLSLQDQAQAETEALAAMVLDPSSKVSLSEFPPSLGKLLETVRARRLSEANLIVSGLPPGAVLTVDGRTVTARSQLPLGKHHLTITALHRRTVNRDFDLTADRSMLVTMPVLLDQPVSEQLSQIAWKGTATSDENTALIALAKRLGVEGLIIAVDKAETKQSRALLVTVSAKVHLQVSLPSWTKEGSDGSAVTLAAWSEQAVREYTLHPPVDDLAWRPNPSGWLVSGQGGAAWADLERSLSGGGGGHITTGFIGVGPELTGDASYGSFLAEVHAAFLGYEISALTLNEGSGEHGKVGGGNTLLAGADLGWRFQLRQGGDPETNSSVLATLGYSYEAHNAQVVENNGQNSGLLTSYTRTGYRIGGLARLPFLPGENVLPAGLLGLGVTPVSTFAESPAGTTGRDPKPDIGLDWSAGLSMETRRHWDFLLNYQGQWRKVNFSGTGTGTLKPAPDNASITETIHVFTLEARRLF